MLEIITKGSTNICADINVVIQRHATNRTTFPQREPLLIVTSGNCNAIVTDTCLILNVGMKNLWLTTIVTARDNSLCKLASITRTFVIGRPLVTFFRTVT